MGKARPAGAAGAAGPGGLRVGDARRAPGGAEALGLCGAGAGGGAEEAGVALHGGGVGWTGPLGEAAAAELRVLGRHEGGVVGLARGGPPEAGAVLTSAGLDGTVRLWDPRQASAEAMRFAVPEKPPLFSCATLFHSGKYLLAAGAPGAVHLFDGRMGHLRALDESFGDDVTNVAFTGMPPGDRLLTGGEDGAISLFKTEEALRGAEDEALVGTYQSEAPVRGLGIWRDYKLWWTTGNETLHLADWRGLLDEDAPTDKLMPSADFTLPREDAARAAKKAGVDALARIDYVVGCVYDTGLQRLMLAAGTSAGALGLFPLSEKSQKVRQPVLVCPPGGRGHSSVVRGAQLSGAQRGALVTAGEDGRVCLWEAIDPSATAPGAGRERPAAKSGRGAQPY